MKEQTPPDQDSIVAEYDRLSRVYDSRWSFYIEATTRETLRRLPLEPADQVLDVGCGTGALLHAVKHQHSGITLAGVDPVPGMLDVARGRLPEDVELREAWAERLPFEDGRFDAIVSCNMFHYIREPRAALAEMHRVLRPGGRLMITDWCDDYLTCRLCDYVLRRFNRAHYRTYRGAECARLLQETGQEGIHIDRYRISWLWDRERIHTGFAWLEEALARTPTGPYTLQASISAVHAEAPSPGETDWARIVRLYEALYRREPSPVIALNRAVAVAMRDTPEAGLRLLDELGTSKEILNYHLYHAARADLYRRAGDAPAAQREYQKALVLASQGPERRFLERRLTELPVS